MSYRIHLSILRKNQINEYLKRTEDKYFNENEDLDFEYETELHDETPIEDFTPIEKFKDSEYSPYILDKNDFQKILDYYKNLIYESIKEKVELTDVKRNEENKILIEDKNAGIHIHFYYIQNYFNGLIKNNKNIDSSGLFLLDYFYLVRLFENLKDDELILITHG